MSQRRNALGRGLGALISSPAASAPAVHPSPSPQGVTPTIASVSPPTNTATDGGLFEIEVARIDPNPDQPRREFAPEALQQLAESIRQHGVLQPVVVRQAGSRYELVMGERRFRASQLAGRRSVPAVVLDVDPADRLELAIVENVQRQDLNPIELALAYQALSQAGHTQEQIGRKVSMDRSSIANHIRLLDLSSTIQADVEAGRLSMGHAKALLQVADHAARETLRSRIVGQSLSVRAAEEAAREIVRVQKGPHETAAGPDRRAAGPRSSAPPASLDPDTRAFVERIERRLQTRVALHPTSGGGGKLEISYFNLEDLERLGNILIGQA